MKFLLACCLFLLPVTTHATEPTTTTMEIKTEKKKGKSEYFEYELSIPTFHHFKNKIFQNKLNSYYKTSMMTFRDTLEKEAKSYYNDAQKNSLSIHPYMVNTDYKVTLHTAPLLSLYTNYYHYTGGAHGMYEWKANTFDITLEKELSLAELFQEHSNYMDKIHKEIQQQIEHNKDIFFPDAFDQVKQTNTLKYFLEPNNMVIYFPLYAIAPYSSGIFPFRIPYTILSQDLKEKYRDVLIDKH